MFTYLILSALIFGFLGSIWNRSNLINVILKFLFFVMAFYAVILIVKT